MYDWIAKLTNDDTALRRIGGVLGVLPGWLMAALCRLLARLLYIASRSSVRRRIESNMADVLNLHQPGVLNTISLNYFRNLVYTLYEILFRSYRLDRDASGTFAVQGQANFDEAMERSQGKGLIVYTPHLGNFFYAYWHLTRKYNCLTIASAGSEELRPMYLKFQAMGCRGLDYDSTPPLEMYRTLKKHLSEGGILFILGDFWRPTFPTSRLFGRLTRTPEGAAMLALENKVPVVPFYSYRLKGFQHQLVFEKPLYLDEQFTRTQRSDANQVLNAFMEQAIREHPSEWFYWFNVHERWEPVRAADDAGESEQAEGERNVSGKAG
ncbi:lysophospholipid acyltransferase family protein [Paenibacillus aestuarii]|uniref:Lysophospholipid acyltransferase family protein n=1 Tax=Paenibacillus aestuarii TaxID=516965 RepID=A0ABW0KHZ1_9BACL|nr:lysophospholipid acyltransferase family protein [Paenibacillus aestuarii]